jgi:hypothetical protein
MAAETAAACSSIPSNVGATTAQCQSDPTDDCTLSYTNEYYTFTESLDWAKRIGSFKFNSCKGRGK